MYNEELDFFIARFRKMNSVRWPYLRYAVNEMYKKYYQRHGTRPDPPVDDVDGEWVDVEDDHDDEVTFKVNTDPSEHVPDNQLDDTLPYVPSPRQQDECQDQQNGPTDNLVYENFAYNDYTDYQTLDPPDQFDDTFYTINDYWDNDDDNELLDNDDTIR